MTSRNLIIEGLTVLKEVFNRPYPIQADPKGYADNYTAFTEDGREIFITIDLREADDVMVNMFGGFSPMIAKKYGWNPNHEIGKIDFTVDDSVGITGRGDAPRILSTVVEAIRLSLTTNRNLVGFMFWGFGRSRSRLYRTMVRRLGRQYNMDVVKNVSEIPEAEALLLADTKKARYMFTQEVFEDIGPKTSKQSIRPYVKNAVRGLTEREQMHVKAPSAISRKGLSNNDLENKLKSPNPTFERILEPMSNLIKKYPGMGPEDVPGNEMYSAKEKIRQRMYDEVIGQKGIPRDEFETRRSHIDSPGPDQTQMGSRGDIFVGQGVLPDEKSRVRPPYDRELDSIRNTLGIKPFSGLTSRTKRGPR